MDFLNKLAKESAEDNHPQQKQQQHGGDDELLGKLGSFVGGGSSSHGEQQKQESSGGMGGLLDKLHGVAGGGPESEKKEDALDKGIDWVQETVFKKGAQDNESAAEQAKDRLIADQIREQYKKATGKEFPVKEKEEEEEASSGGLGGLGKKFGF